MEKKPQNFVQFIKTLNLIYNSVLLGLLLFMTVAYYNTEQATFSLSTTKGLLYVGFGFSVISVLIAIYLYKNTIKNLKKNQTLGQKLRFFLITTLFKKLVPLEISGITNTFLFAITQNKVFLIFTAISILGMLLAKPTPERIIRDLDLNKKEQSYINQPETTFN